MQLLPLLTLGQDINPPRLGGDAPAALPAQPAGETATQVPADGNNGLPPAQNNPGGGGDMFSLLLPIILIFGVMWIFMATSGRKEKKKRQAVLDALKKGAKVQTVGGILGTVVEVRDDEVVVKVDENANTRLRFSKGAIQTVHDDGDKTAATATK